MNMRTRKEVTKAVATRYRKGTRKSKECILDEFCKTTGYNRDYAATILRAKEVEESAKSLKQKHPPHRSGRPPQYTDHTRRILILLWNLFDRICAKRLAVLIRTALPSLCEDSFLGITAEQAHLLLTISPATIDRMIKPIRVRLQIRGHCYTRPSGGLKESIPVRTFGEWASCPPGHCQIDTVGHDGGVLSQQCAFTLCLTDIASGWTERFALQNRAFKWIFIGLERMKASLPFPLLHLHPDNGSEFINYGLISWCAAQTPPIALSRSRAGKKNDNCYVEQKNFDTIRKLVGYARYASQETLETLNALYEAHGLLLNYFYPSQKLITKTRSGSNYKKTYDMPKSPAARLLESPAVDETTKTLIRARLSSLNPLALSRQVDALSEHLLATLALQNASVLQP
jgi:hypothetical protein